MNNKSTFNCFVQFTVNSKMYIDSKTYIVFILPKNTYRTVEVHNIDLGKMCNALRT